MDSEKRERGNGKNPNNVIPLPQINGDEDRSAGVSSTHEMAELRTEKILWERKIEDCGNFG